MGISMAQQTHASALALLFIAGLITAAAAELNGLEPGRRAQRSGQSPLDASRPAPPDHPEAGKEHPPRRHEGQKYSIDQAISDQAQLHTIAFDALAFLTGDFAADTFLPPGKVSDYFGFQYMRDIDAAGRGHNTSFLTRIANNMLAILDSQQKAQLIELAKQQAPDIRQFAENGFP